MQIDLTGRRAIVTGSTGGIGFAIAAGLAGAGAEVVVNGRTDEATRAAVDRIASASPGARLTPLAGDLSTAQGVEAFVARAHDADILVNNVGRFHMKPFTEAADSEWTELFELNVMSGVRLSRHYLPGMLQRDWGRIIFIASESALNVGPTIIPYSVTKASQLVVSRGLAETTAGTGVTVNAVLPGPTRTTGLDKRVRDIAAAEGKAEADVERDIVTTMRPTSLLRRLAQPREVANLVVYVASDLSSATNGAALRVDGGVVNSIS